MDNNEIAVEDILMQEAMGSEESAPVVEEVQGEAPVADVAPIVDTTAPPVIAEPNQDMMAIQEQLANLQQGMEQLKPETPMTDEEAALNELAERLGINKMQEQLKEKDATIQQLQQYQHELMVQKGIAQLKAEKPNFDESLVAKELHAISLENPALAASLDNPQGWSLLWDAKFQQTAQPKPDPIVGSTQPVQGGTRDAMNKLKTGEINGVDAGDLILQIANQS